MGKLLPFLLVFVLPLPVLGVFIAFRDTAQAAGSARPTAHFRPAIGYIGDVHPLYHQGRFYLPCLTTTSDRRRLFVSSLFVSNDMAHWQELPLKRQALCIPDYGPKGISWQKITERQDNLDIDAFLSEEPPWWLVTVIYDEKSGYYFDYYPRRHAIYAYVSDDIQNWGLYLPGPVLRGDPARFREFRDPFVFWNEDEESYWMLLTLNLADQPEWRGGAIGYASSSDLINWSFGGVLLHPGHLGSPECPEMFKLGDKWYLLTGFKPASGGVGPTTYFVSDSCYGPWQTPSIDTLAGPDFCVGNSVSDGRERYVLAWIPTYRGTARCRTPEWGGDLAFPRQLVRGPKGELYTCLPDPFRQIIRAESLYSFPGDPPPEPTAGRVNILAKGVEIPGGTLYGSASLPGRYERFDLEAHFVLTADTRVTGIVLSTDDEQPGLEISVDTQSEQLIVRFHGDPHYLAHQPVDLSGTESFVLESIVEHDIVEVFLDERFSLAARLPAPLEDMAVSFFSEGACVITGIHLYELADLSTSRRADEDRGVAMNVTPRSVSGGADKRKERSGE